MNANTEIKKETLDLLKRIYYKLQMTDKYNDIVNQINNMNNRQGKAEMPSLYFTFSYLT